MVKLRRLTSDERKSTTDLLANKKNIVNEFLDKLSEKLYEYRKLYRPFDSFGANIDFQTKIQNRIFELQTSQNKEIKNRSFEDFNLDSYADCSLFEFMGSEDVKAERLIDGFRQEIVIGKRFKYKTKKRGNKISIVVPKKDVKKVEKWMKETFNAGDDNETSGSEEGDK